MNYDVLEIQFKRISELEKKIENYFKILKVDNELDFILNGTYLLENELESILNGTY